MRNDMHPGMSRVLAAEITVPIARLFKLVVVRLLHAWNANL